MASFFIALALLFVVIFANSLLTPKPQEVPTETKVKDVSVYKIGAAPRLTLSGEVKKESVVEIKAQTPAIVSKVHVVPGQHVNRGTTLVSLSSNYSGGNPASVQAQIASTQYKNLKDTHQAQKDLIGKQRELADKNRESADKMRDITNQSLGETKSLLSLNENILSTIDTNLATLEANNIGGINDATILQTKQLKSQFLGATNQIRSGLRATEFQAGTDNAPNQLAQIQVDIAKKQLDLQEKALNLGLEIGRLQVALANVSAAAFFPTAPFSGVVERVNVAVGESVSPGTILVTIAGNKQSATVIVTVPKHVARNISTLEESYLTIGDRSFAAIPQYVSTEATDGQLNSVLYVLEEEAYDLSVNGQFIQVDMPVGLPDTIKTIPYLPIDIIFQTQDGPFVYIVVDGRAQSRKVELGEVVGRYVSVTSGLEPQDHVILDRSVIVGQEVHEI